MKTEKIIAIITVIKENKALGTLRIWQ